MDKVEQKMNSQKFACIGFSRKFAKNVLKIHQEFITFIYAAHRKRQYVVHEGAYKEDKHYEHFMNNVE